MPISRTVAAAVTAAFAIVSLSGCGFIAAGNKSSTKPSGFVLTGQAAVALPAGDAASVGSPCQAPAGATDIASDVSVTVTSPAGATIAAGNLGTGVVTGTSSALICSFPFQIAGVPGGQATYGVSIGNRPAQSFSGDQLRQSGTAIVTIAPTQ